MRNMSKWVNPDLKLNVSKEDSEEEVQETESTDETVAEEPETETVEETVETPETEEVVESDPEIVEAAPEAVEAAELIVPGIPEVPVDEEVLFQAEAVAEEEAEESAEIREGMDDAKDDMETIEEDTASVENFEKVLRHGIKTGKFSPQLIAVASHTVNNLAKRYAVEAEAGVSIESFKSVTLKEQYTTSLEAFEGLKKALKAAGNRIAKFLKDAFDPKYLERAKVENMRADKLASELTKKKGDKNEYEVGTLAAVLSGGEKDFVKKITADAKIFGDVIGKGLSANRSYFTSATKILNDITATKKGGDASGKVKAFIALKAPVDSYPKAAFNEILVGGMCLNHDKRIPHTAEKVGSRVVCNPVTNSDLVQLIKIAKIYAAMPASAVNQADKKTLEQLDKAVQHFLYGKWDPEETIKGIDNSMVSAIDEMSMIAWSHNDVVWWMSDAPVGIAKRINDLVERIIKQME